MTPAQLRMARTALRLGVRDLALAAGVTTATITRFENERGGINSATEKKLADTLAVDGIEFVSNERGEGVIKLRRT